MLRRLSLLAALGLALLPVAVGCANDEHALLIRAQADGDIDTLDVTVLTTSGDRVGERVFAVVDRRIDRSAADIGEDPIRIAITLPRAGDYLVHITGRGETNFFVATRCYSVSGVKRDDVALVSVGSGDADGDTYVVSPEDVCTDPGPDGARKACDHACPATIAQDCDDSDRLTFPGAPEVCEDGKDQDCNGEDADCADRDGDGVIACNADGGDDCDCDDADENVFPGAEETCGDGIDQDCSGADDLCDRDDDGYPADKPTGGAPDCDDTNPDINPGASEVCTAEGGTAADEDCDGFTDELADCVADDLDQDGVTSCAVANPPDPCDCNDCDPGIRPGADDKCGNGVDEDCNGSDRMCAAADMDRDGDLGSGVGDPDCNDMLGVQDSLYDVGERTYHGAPEKCGDGLVQDCDNATTGDPVCMTDADSDQYDAPVDCDDDSSAVNPGATELCDEVDNDCDGTKNEVTTSGTGCIADARIPGCLGADKTACQVDFMGSVYHCGGCRLQCELEKADACVGGTCDCAAEAGTGACTGANLCCADGCANPQNDVNHCGSCANDCSTSAAYNSCVDGQCACGPTNMGFRVCGGTCVNSRTDNQRCGAGCLDCTTMGPANSTGVCDNGTCDWSCASGYHQCGGACVADSVNTPTSCGSSCEDCTSKTIPAGATATCVPGGGGHVCAWTCESNQKQCGANTCVPKTTNTVSQCGEPCTDCNVSGGSIPAHASRVCESGSCDWACDASYTECGNTCVADGTFTCGTGGACNACPSPPPNAHAICMGGGNSTCGVECDNGFVDCGGTCISVQSDEANCGGCNIACGADETCSGGKCTCGTDQGTTGGGAICEMTGEICCTADNRCRSALACN